MPAFFAKNLPINRLPRGLLRHTIRLMYQQQNAYRTLCSTVWTAALKLRVLVMMSAVVLAPLGVSFKFCHCTPCGSNGLTAACCCSNLQAASCCDEVCCDHQNCCSIPTAVAGDDLQCGCGCHVCQCDPGLIVDPKSFPLINDGDPPLLDDICWFVELATADLSAGKPGDCALPLARDIRVLHCRWLI